MAYQFQKHYTREEARALLPQLRAWLECLTRLQTGLERTRKRLASLAQPGQDQGGQLVNDSIRAQAELAEILAEFQRREILIKDLDRGLVDFPAILGGREVFLCWERDEEDIEHWHELHAGYAGREKL